MRKHRILFSDYKDVLKWLEENVQENYNQNGDKFGMSSVGQFVEWRSKDKESWILRISGSPPKVFVEIKDEEKELLFLLRWQ